ncbi:MAG: hypothetical protein QM710_09050 [Flavobacterium sp.]
MDTNKALSKVAKITVLFWLLKIIGTTLGETLGDYISMTLDLGYAIGIGITLLVFLTVLILQLYSRKHIPLLYWSVIIATTTLGTEISDFIDRSLHMGYASGTLLLAFCLGLTLLIWFKKYKNLEVFPIAERTKELYYWIAILFSNSLGTAFGDFLSDNLGLGYLYGAIITGSIILLVVMLHYLTKINHILLFWIAFIFTRPFGATFGDFLTKPSAKGGLDFGRLTSSLIAMALMLLLIYLSKNKTKNKVS